MKEQQFSFSVSCYPLLVSDVEKPVNWLVNPYPDDTFPYLDDTEVPLLL